MTPNTVEILLRLAQVATGAKAYVFVLSCQQATLKQQIDAQAS